jgi:hypothetical protein
MEINRKPENRQSMLGASRVRGRSYRRFSGDSGWDSCRSSNAANDDL